MLQCNIFIPVVASTAHTTSEMASPCNAGRNSHLQIKVAFKMHVILKFERSRICRLPSESRPGLLPELSPGLQSAHLPVHTAG